MTDVSAKPQHATYRCCVERTDRVYFDMPGSSDKPPSYAEVFEVAAMMRESAWERVLAKVVHLAPVNHKAKGTS